MNSTTRKLYINLISKYYPYPVKRLVISSTDKSISKDRIHFDASSLSINIKFKSHCDERITWRDGKIKIGITKDWVDFSRSALLIQMYGSEEAALIAKLKNY